MSSLREKNKMSQEERLQFLEKQISLQIGTINKDGSPHLTTMGMSMMVITLFFILIQNHKKLLI